ncbi:hypothetical protein [Methylocaldum sp. GT1TLB]|jgi:hypothetical protein|uniref:hypothetical protein n=1 Tax=Methylocaldum sp. GT1TLB TaxID=3438965 RepID=UPI003DA1C7CE
MLRLVPFDDPYCQGLIFEVTDINALAKAIAIILVQEYEIARRLVIGDSFSVDVIKFENDDIEDIIQRRLHPADIYHRDGFLFQLMMWLAAHLDLQNGDLVSLPHSQASAKGQDSIIVHRSTSAVAALTICEDKATENPRKTIREDVWPEIADYEKGGRWDELRSTIIATLGIGGIPMAEAVKLIRNISWAGKRRYRVRVTVNPNNQTSVLFKGFDEIVSGAKEIRRGETVPLPAMRDWMTMLAEKVESELRSFASGA